MAKDIQDEEKVHGYVTACDVSQGGRQTGAWMGGLFGALSARHLFGSLAWARPSSPGRSATALLGGVEGALAGSAMGGILSGLSAWGISKQQILEYEETVKAGSYLLVAHGSPEDVAQAQTCCRAPGLLN